MKKLNYSREVSKYLRGCGIRWPAMLNTSSKEGKEKSKKKEKKGQREKTIEGRAGR